MILFIYLKIWRDNYKEYYCSLSASLGDTHEQVKSSEILNKGAPESGYITHNYTYV